MAPSSTQGKEPKIIVSCDTFEMGRQFVLKGLGFMIEATAPFADDVKAGRVVQILPNALSQLLSVYAVYPANAPADSPARLFVEFMMNVDAWSANWLIEDGHFALA